MLLCVLAVLIFLRQSVNVINMQKALGSVLSTKNKYVRFSHDIFTPNGFIRIHPEGQLNIKQVRQKRAVELSLGEHLYSTLLSRAL